MDVEVRLSALPVMHPLLLWGDIILATVAVFEDLGQQPPFRIPVEVRDVPGFGSDEVCLRIDSGGVRLEQVDRLRRTYEASRRVEMAAIAVTGLTLHHVGGHEITDLAVRGSAADYLVDAARHQLEIAGRSRRWDVPVAWDQRWDRLRERLGGGFYVCVLEFETPAGKLAFAPER